jgi:hypothetical protein
MALHVAMPPVYFPLPTFLSTIATVLRIAISAGNMTLVTTRFGLCYTFGDGSSGQQAVPLDRYIAPQFQLLFAHRLKPPFLFTGATLSHEHDINCRSGRRLVTRPHAVTGLPPLLHTDGATCGVACGGAHVVVAVRAARQCECPVLLSVPTATALQAALSNCHTLQPRPSSHPHPCLAIRPVRRSWKMRRGCLTASRFGAGDATRAVSLARLLPVLLCWYSHSVCM